MKRNNISTFLLIVGSVLLFVGIFSPLLPMIFASGNLETSIIGAANGPSYWFAVYALMDGWPIYADVVGALLLLSAFAMLLRIRKQ